MKAEELKLRTLPPQVGEQSTLLSGWVVLIYRLLKYKGLNAKQIFRESGMNLSLLGNPEARIPHHIVTNKIWRPAAKIIGHKAFVMDAAKVIFPSMYHSLSLAMYHAPNLLTSLQYLTKYRRVFHPLSGMRVIEVNDGYQFIWGSKKPYVLSRASDAVIASAIGLCRQLTTEKFAPKLVCLKHQLSPFEIEKYEEFFKAPVICGQGENVMAFEPTLLHKKLLTANPRMEQMCVQTTRDYVSALDSEEITNTIYCKIIESLPSQEHAEEAIADDLHVSLRTMQRRLRDAGTSYGQLLQETRKELALSYMNNRELSIQEISHLVGFSEPANFSRAFKRWTGTSPKTYRLGKLG